MDNDKWLTIAKNKIETLDVGKKFEVKDLFETVEWTKLTKGERIGFGRFFANEVKEGKIEEIEALERGKNNHSRYKKN